MPHTSAQATRSPARPDWCSLWPGRALDRSASSTPCASTWLPYVVHLRRVGAESALERDLAHSRPGRGADHRGERGRGIRSQRTALDAAHALRHRQRRRPVVQRSSRAQLVEHDPHAARIVQRHARSHRAGDGRAERLGTACGGDRGGVVSGGEGGRERRHRAQIDRGRSRLDGRCRDELGRCRHRNVSRASGDGATFSSSARWCWPRRFRRAAGR